MLTIDKLTLNINETPLLKNLGVTIFPGAVVNIYGNNGCGKTSLLKVLSGLKDFESGQILFDLERPEEEVRYLAHNNALKGYLTVLENLEFWAGLSGDKILIPAALSYFNLEGVQDRVCSELSAGQKRLVALAKLLVTPGKIWLLDEPFSNLDDKNHEKVKQLITGKVSDGGITILTSHQKINFLDVINISLEDYKIL